MHRTLILLLNAGLLFGGDCISSPCSTAANFAYDLIGSPDARPGTWGMGGSQTYKLTFKVPTGYRARILRVYGDFVVWPRGTPLPDAGDNVVGHSVGVLFGLSSTAPDGSLIASGGGASDNCFLYIQDSSKGESRRAPFDFDTHVGGLLQDDGTMLVKAAVWLNTTGLAIHMEPSFTIVFQFEKQE
jgi:hypothetical protein